MNETKQATFPQTTKAPTAPVAPITPVEVPPEQGPPGEVLPVDLATEDAYDILDINGEEFTVRSTVLPKRGKATSSKLLILLEPEKDDKGVIDFWGLITRVRKAVGEVNFDKTAYAELIRAVCIDCTQQAVKESTDGIPSNEGLAKAIIDWFNSETRRGEHVKDIKNKSLALYAELTPYLLRAYSKPEDGMEPLTEQERLYVLQKMAEFQVLNKKMEEIGKKGKARKGVKVAPAKVSA